MNDNILFFAVDGTFDVSEEYLTRNSQGRHVVNLDNLIVNRGYNKVIDFINESKSKIFLTSIPCFLRNEMFWDNEANVANDSNIYFLIDADYRSLTRPIRCVYLTDKEIRKSHNIESMYINGAFDDELNKIKNKKEEIVWKIK